MARIAHALRPAAPSAPAVAAAFASLGDARASAGPRPSSGRVHEAERQALCHAVLDAARAAIPAG